MTTAAAAEAGGNSAAAHACQKGGYRSLVGTNGGFTNVGECVSYAARGGTFVTPQHGEFLIPAGETAMLSDTVLSACNDLTYGYQVSGGSNTALGGKSAGCATTSEPDATIGPFPTAVIVRLCLTDNTCGGTFYSHGNHATVTGTNPHDVDITDAGGLLQGARRNARPPGPFGGLTIA